MVTPPAVRVKSRVKREVEGDSGVAPLLAELLAALLPELLPELLAELLAELLPGRAPAGAEAFAGVFWAEAGLAVWVWLGDPDWLDAAYPTPRPSARARVAATPAIAQRLRPARATMARSSSEPGSGSPPTPSRSCTGMSSGSIPCTNPHRADSRSPISKQRSSTAPQA